jgi:geranylgeranyl diphosphate synthase type II
LLLLAGERNGVGAHLCLLMSKASLEICEGHQLDMDFESLASPTESEYLEMIRKKTSCLFGVSLQLGALLAGASEVEAKALYDFGEKMGLGFQIQDDYLDVFGDSGTTGKQQGGDILRGKKNFLYVHLYNILPPPDQKIFASLYAESSLAQHIEPVLQWYTDQKVGQYVSDIQLQFLKDATAHLDVLGARQLSSLHAFTQSLLNRTF